MQAWDGPSPHSHAIFRCPHIGVVREELLIFLHVYTVAVSHQINFTTNKLALLNKTKQCLQAVREYT